MDVSWALIVVIVAMVVLVGGFVWMRRRSRAGGILLGPVRGRGRSARGKGDGKS